MACELVELEHFLKCLMYQDRDKDKIVKYVLCADTHKLKMGTQRVYLDYVKHFPLIITHLMHRDT